MESILRGKAITTEQELWAPVVGYPNYLVSSFGNVYNLRLKKSMSTSLTYTGHRKVSISKDTHRITRSVAYLVAEAFVSRPDERCDHVVVLDDDAAHIAATNLVWRPRWFLFKYTEQMRTSTPPRYLHLPVINSRTQMLYDSIYEAGTTEGLLFKDIWLSAHNGNKVYPYASWWEFPQRV